MNIKFPENCNNESSRWSFCIKLNEALRLWHNENCKGLSLKQAEAWRKANFYSRLNVVMVERNKQIEISRVGDHWNPKVPDHVSGGIINYPPGLNQDNEGSRASFLFGIEHRLILMDKDFDSIDGRVIQIALFQAKQDAINSIYWSPTIEDIT